MKSKSLFPVLIGLLIGLAAGFLIASSAATGDVTSNGVTKEIAGQLVMDYLAVNDISATLLVVNEFSGLYDVVVKDANGVASDVYVTKDGLIFVQPAVVGVKNVTDNLLIRRAFFECLASKGMLFYGSTDTNTTVLQFQVFGGTQFVDRIYVPCEGNYTQMCIDSGITEVPTFVYQNQSYTGARELGWFVNLTGCGA